MGGKESYNRKIITTNPIAYWPLNELTGTTAINYGSLGTDANGAYSGATLAQIAAPGGGLAPLFDGVNDFVNVYSATLNGGFVGTLGSVMLWSRKRTTAINGGVRLVIYVDSSNRIFIYQPADTSADFIMSYKAGTIEELSATYTGAVDTWYQTVITFTDAGDKVIFYVNGEQYGATATGIGTWVGALSSTTCVLGCQNTSGLTDFDGYLAHAAIWDRVLTPAEVLSLYNGGIATLPF